MKGEWDSRKFNLIKLIDFVAQLQSDLLELFGLNLHRIEKDVNRCDRNYYYFSNENVANLDKLRNIICTYVWEHLEVGYMQGMCDLLAPILVIEGNYDVDNFKLEISKTFENILEIQRMFNIKSFDWEFSEVFCVAILHIVP